jgi:hypothetical protein
MAAMNRFSATAIVLALVGILVSPHSFASESSAVNVSGYYANGYVNGFAGFSFTPTVNIAVNNVSYLDSGANATPSITFWSGTNALVTYVLPPGSASNQWISYTNTPLILNAGTSYSITLQNGSDTLLFTDSYPQGSAPDGQFLPSAEIAN